MQVTFSCDQCEYKFYASKTLWSMWIRVGNIIWKGILNLYMEKIIWKGILNLYMEKLLSPVINANIRWLRMEIWKYILILNMKTTRTLEQISNGLICVLLATSLSLWRASRRANLVGSDSHLWPAWSLYFRTPSFKASSPFFLV